ncbi:unnamed protein product [Adineta steineri]|uniref:FAD dependent oxidoreductase n=1 Tax=Adineta steineri TaxID=433720 RepID=A0A814ZG40_9BILA|nr:unnamed protein product [Adineta steineri]
MLAFISILFITIHTISSSIRTIDDCQLLIVGGTTSALGAVLSASKLNTRVCLLEPTDWVGGQLTAELLSAPDFAFHTVTDKDTNFTLNVGSIDQQLNNQNPLFSEMLNVLGDTGRCWVSPKCSIPELFHSQVILPLLNKTRIFYNTVIKHIKKDVTGRRIIQIDAIQRTPRQSSSERCRFLSEELPDWYSEEDSAWFTKTQLSFTNISFVIEGTSWGEVLVLSNASYLQGLMEKFDGDTSGIGNSTCGQSFTFDFLEQLQEKPVDEPPNPLPPPIGGANYSFLNLPWERIWTYRRVNTSALDSYTVAVNDLTIQNWGGGNDYRREFFFLSPSDTEHQRDTNQWQGGVNLDAIQNAERQAYGYHYWYRQNAPTKWANRTVLVRSVLAAGTCHGLAKMPYLREARRSIGFENFLMNITTISGHARDLHGHIFYDHLCIGAYDVDIHSMIQCTYPSYMTQYYPILPYYIPLRAMTNRDIDNLIVVGKTMAQTFLVNSATRLHPVEFSIGQTAGVVGSYAVENKLTSVSEMLKEEHLKRVQTLVRQFTPTSWTINGTRYPDD